MRPISRDNTTASAINGIPSRSMLDHLDSDLYPCLAAAHRRAVERIGVDIPQTVRLTGNEILMLLNHPRVESGTDCCHAKAFSVPSAFMARCALTQACSCASPREPQAALA